ncbi:MAG: tRNA (adenosine(37)-N6)-threonylcarbamoyltransferase complex ATPase subunit type 1 TsaE [Bacteroidia bacterium]|nr:tRNA (adenosine(37)-N6)-threonylcarbamoyltransferase complex ATPase subunit type 1 TsaE [Bacteroidia bacterium]
MEKFQFLSHSVEETQNLAKKILQACKGRKIFAIYGDLGAGKTTLIQGICQELGSPDAVKSPTFSIVNEYEYPGGRIFHFDFYRIKHITEAFDLGYEEYFDSGEFCFVEWPEKIEGLVPDEAVHIRLTAPDSFSRNIEVFFD